MAYIELVNVNKKYISSNIVVDALNDINLEIEKGELVCILGPSGSGKTTLLNLIGGIDSPTNGQIFVDGKDITKFGEKDLLKYRKNKIGFVFQFYNLLPNLTVRENIELVLDGKKSKIDIDSILKSVSLDNKDDAFPSQLSGGEQLRVCIARSIVKRPEILLCDEPTGALDYKNSKQVLRLLEWVSKNLGITILIVTHNDAIKNMSDKVIKLRNDGVESVYINDNKKNIDEIEW